MKKVYRLIALIISILSVAYVNGQVLNPNDPVVTYNPSNPPATPPWDSIGKWVRTKDMSWNSDQYKAYYYRGTQFRLMFPKSWSPNDNKTYPVVIFFHGVGEKGTIYDNELQLLWEGKRFLDANNNGEYDGFVLYPQNTTGGWSNSEYPNIIDIINYMAKNVKLDLNRVFTSGLSGGGSTCWDFLINYPTYTACSEIISASYTALSNYINNPLKYVPIWLSQGMTDGAPSPYTSEQIVLQLQNVGAPITYTEYPGLGHGIWDVHYAEPDAFPYFNRANKVNPVVFFGKTLFCPSDTDNINVTLGLVPGFDGYQWMKNNEVIQGATSNTLTVTSLGTYAARVKRGSTWSYWSPTPVVIGVKPPTQTPDIKVSGMSSSVIPAPDGSTSVTLTLPAGYSSYQWKKQGSSTVLGTQQTFTTSATGNYIAQVTETGGCSSNPSAPFYVASASGPNPPDPASNVVGFATSQTQINLSWTDRPSPIHNETGFEIYRGTTAGGPYQLVHINPADSVTYIDNNLSANTRYYYVVRSIDSTAAAAPSAEISVATQVDKEPPVAPTVQLTGTSQSSISISWTGASDNVGITQYYIYVNGSKSYTTTDSSYTIPGLTHDQVYAIYVKAVDPTGNLSIASNQISAAAVYKGLTYKYYTYTGSWSKLPDLTTLTPVKTGVVNNVSLDPRTQETNYAFEWDGYINIRSKGTYKFFTSSDDGSLLYINGTKVVSNDGLHGTTEQNGSYTFNSTGVYPIRILFYQEGGGAVMTVSWQKTSSPTFSKGAIPDSAFVETFTMPGNAPAAPTTIKATAAAYNVINLTWADKSNNETGFEIYRASSLSGPYSIIATTGSNATSYADSSLAPSTTYYYKVQAVNQYGSSGFNAADLGGLQYKYYTYTGSWSKLPNLATLTPVKTGTVNNITLDPATQTTNYAFEWTGNINITSKGTYKFFTSSDDGSLLYISTTKVVSNDGLHGTTEQNGSYTFNSTGIYPIKIQFYQEGGDAVMTASWQKTSSPTFNKGAIPDSVFANTNMSATTLSAPPVPLTPSRLTATATSTSTISVSWMDRPSYISKFVVYRSLGDDSHFQYLRDVPASTATTVSFTDSALYPHTIYYYKVQAQNGMGVSTDFSNTDSAQTNDNPPVLENIGNQSMRYDGTLQLNIIATDPDGDHLTLTAANLPSFATFVDYGDGSGLITFTPSQTGTYPNITVTAADQYGGVATNTFTLDVNNNYPPVIPSLPDVNVNTGSSFTETITVTDANEDDNLDVQVQGLPAFASVNTISNGQIAIVLNPGYGDAGTYTVNITATDPHGATVSKYLHINVVFANPPVKKWDLSFEYQTAAGAPWNNITGVTTNNLKDDQGNATNVGLALQTSWWSAWYNGAVTGNNSGVYPDNVMQDYYYFGIFGGPDVVSGKITGLDVDKTYDISFFASSVWTNVSDNGHTVFQIGDKIDSIDVQNNTANTLTFSKVAPAADGTITFTMSKGIDAAVGYLNAMTIQSNFQDGSAPAKPSGFSVQLNGTSNAQLSWTLPQYNTAKTFEIYRSTSATSGFTLLNPEAQNGGESVYTDSSLAGQTTYYYTMRAVNDNGASAYTDTLSVTTQAKKPVFDPMSAVTMKYGDKDTVLVNVTADPSDVITLTSSGLPGFAALQVLGNGNGRIVLNPASTDVGTYTITVIATTDHGGKDSASVNVTVNNKYLTPIYINFTDGVIKQAAPWNNMGNYAYAGVSVNNMVDASNNPTTVSITTLDQWSGSTSDAGNAFNTYSNTGLFPDNVMKGFYFQQDNNVRRLQITGLDPNMKYNFVFYANAIYNAANYTTNYSIGSQTVTLNGFQNINNVVQISAVQPDNNGTVLVNVQRASGADFGLINAMIIEGYSATTTDIFGPTDLSAYVLSTTTPKIQLNWRDHAFNETGFTVWRATSLNGTYTKIATLAANATSYQDNNPGSNTRYFYKVQATGSGSATSDFSNVASATTAQYSVYFSVNNTEAPAPSPWNNTNAGPSVNATYPNLLNSDGNGSGITISFPSAFEGENPVGTVTGNNSGVFPDKVILGEYYLESGLDTAVMKISGLNLSMRYSFILFGSLTGYGWNNVSLFSINNQTRALSTAYNKNNTVQFDNIAPDGNGEVTIKVIYAPGSSFAIFGAMVIKGYTNYNDNGSPIISARLSQKLIGGANSGDTGNDLKAYPNPFHNTLQLQIPVKQGDGKLRVEVLNLGGQVVYSQSLGELPAGSNTVTLNLSGQHLTDGAYIVRVASSDKPAAPRSIIVLRQ